MNENINLCKILKDCPKGMVLYSPLVGDVRFDRLDRNGKTNICVKDVAGREWWFRCDGKHMRWFDAAECWTMECMLFPSKDQRDWSKFKVPVKRFDPKTFQPFDKVLTRDGKKFTWVANFFNCFTKADSFCFFKNRVAGIGDLYPWKCCIPYNDETKHLLGTTDDCPEYYKWWTYE